MPRDVSGNTQPLPGTIVSTGDTILPSQHNPMVNDVYAMMTQSLSRDGQGGMRAPLDMSNFRVINVAAATQPNDAVSLSQLQTGTPVGTVVDFAGSNAPETWLLCFGQAVSRSEYPLLFSVIGTTYGAGNGSTTFNVPDYRGRVIAGKDNMGGTNANRLGTFSGFTSSSNIGESGGLEVVTLSLAQIPSHDHGGITSTNGDHTHPVLALSSGTSPAISANPGTGFSPANVSTSSSGSHNHSIPSAGGGQSHLNVQPTIIANKIIKVSY